MKKLMITFGFLALILFMLMNVNDVVLAQRPGNPPNQGQDRNFMGQHPGGFWSKLTDEQRTAVQEKIKQLRDQGATPEEIHAAVKEMLQDWGIQLPEICDNRPGFGRFGHRADGAFSQLTDEQRKAVHDKIKELREQDATPEEIHATVKEMLQGWGIQLPENWDNRPGFGRFGHRPDGVFSQLTDEQRKELRATIKELFDQGKSREEIKAAVKTLLEGWGIKLPENWDQMPGFHPFRHGHGGFWSQLTDEQRKQVRDKIKELRDQGATREEIHAAIQEMLKEFGIKPPEGQKGQPGQQPGDRSKFSANQETEKAVTKAKNTPNPFNPETNISYTLQNSEHVKVSIYNLQGQLIRTLVNETQPAGSYTVCWNGRQENGVTAVSGMYLYRIEAGGQTLTQKMILMK